MKKYFENPEARKEQSEKRKKYFENPEARKEHGKKMKRRFENPEARKEQSEKMKKYYEENPDAKQKNIKKRLDVLGKNKPFDIFKSDGTFIKTFSYQYEAKKYLQTEYNITSNISINAVLAGRMKTSAGFIFKYK